MSSRVALTLVTAAVTTFLSAEAWAQECEPPRILFVVDTSTSMNGVIEEGGAETTKWAAAQEAISSVLTMFPEAAQYGLMTYPGAAGACSTGSVIVEVGAGTASTIKETVNDIVVTNGRYTPGGQSLMVASQYAPLLEEGFRGHVVFVTDGHQWCSVDGNQYCVTESDCDLMGVGTCPSCGPDLPDGCFCVQDWSVLGAEALTSAGVTTHVVGFGAEVNFRALNQTADAGGTAMPGCDPNSNAPSCYIQATLPSELSAAFESIVEEVAVDVCTGPCGIEGQRTCGLDGWSDCDAPAIQSCVSTCNTPGTQQCVNDALTACSSEVDCGGGATVSSSVVSSASVAVSSAASGGGAGGAGGSGGGNAVGDPEADGGCACRMPGAKDSSKPERWAGLLSIGLAVLALSRRRR